MAQRVTGSDTKKNRSGKFWDNSKMKAQMAVMDGSGFPVKTDASGLEAKFWHKRKGSYGISSLSSQVEA